MGAPKLQRNTKPKVEAVMKCISPEEMTRLLKSDPFAFGTPQFIDPSGRKFPREDERSPA